MEFILHGRIFVPVTAAQPSLEGRVEEHLRVLERDYRKAPEGTAEPIRIAYERMAEALIDAQRFRILLPQLKGYWLNRYADTTHRLCVSAMGAYQHAQLHLQKPDGENAFAQANHHLDNVSRTILDQFALHITSICDTFPTLNPVPLLEGMKRRIAAIMEVKQAPPRRVGDNYIIQEYIPYIPRIGLGISGELLGWPMGSGEPVGSDGNVQQLQCLPPCRGQLVVKST